MQIGSEVKYIRYNHTDDAIQTGTGVVLAYGLDPEKRVIALIRDNVKRGQDGKLATFNTPLKGVNPTPEFEKDFEEMLFKVKDIEETANSAIRKLTDDANAEIIKLHDEVLGEAVNLDEPQAETEAQA